MDIKKSGKQFLVIGGVVVVVLLIVGFMKSSTNATLASIGTKIAP
ncbi:MAG: hypothetical protein WBR15_10875 [Gammaproteobacteria bacterium]